MGSQEFSKQTFRRLVVAVLLMYFSFPFIMKVKGEASCKAFNSFEKLSFPAVCEWVRLKGFPQV